MNTETNTIIDIDVNKSDAVSLYNFIFEYESTKGHAFYDKIDNIKYATAFRDHISILFTLSEESKNKYDGHSIESLILLLEEHLSNNEKIKAHPKTYLKYIIIYVFCEAIVNANLSEDFLQDLKDTL